MSPFVYGNCSAATGSRRYAGGRVESPEDMVSEISSWPELPGGQK